jgi:apolipoprotein N-acyltransferase
MTKATTFKPLTGQRISFYLSASFAMGALLCFSFAPYHAWALAILLPALLFKIWERLNVKLAFFSGWLFGAGLFGAGVSWVYNSISHFSGASSFFSLCITLLFILFLGLFFGLLAWVIRRCFDTQSNLQVLCVFPALWMLTEWLIGHLFTGFPWLVIGYTQLTTPLHVFAPIVGVYGLSYLTILFAAILVVLTRRGPAKIYWSCWGLLAVIVLLSLWAKHHSWTHTTQTKQSVALVQANIEPTMKWQPQTLTHIQNTYLHLSNPLWPKNSLVIWPESALPITPSFIPQWLTLLQQTVTNNHTHLITGIITRNHKAQYFNSAMLLSPQQKPQIYNKRHLVPFGEYFPFQNAFAWFYRQLHMPMSSLTSGKNSQPLLTYGPWKIAPYICYEIAYPEEVMQTMGNANLLLVISDDSWFGKGLASLQHLGIAQMRALETGRYVLFSNNSGPSAVITPEGKIMAESKLHAQATVSAPIEANTS